MPRFFSDIPLSVLSATASPGEATNRELPLPDGIFHHAIRVRRLKIGDTCTLFDERGEACRVTLTRLDKRQAHARIDAVLPAAPPPSLPITLALAVTAAERMDWALQKGVELGVSAFLPFYGARSNARLDASHQARRAGHWRGILISACEQCGQNRLPALLPLAAFDEVLDHASRPGVCRLLLDASAAVPLPALLRAQAAPSQAVLMIGPEGGFTGDELAAARTAGWQSARLGPRILRFETAAAAAVTLVQAAWGELGQAAVI